MVLQLEQGKGPLPDLEVISYLEVISDPEVFLFRAELLLSGLPLDLELPMSQMGTYVTNVGNKAAAQRANMSPIVQRINAMVQALAELIFSPVRRSPVASSHRP